MQPAMPIYAHPTRSVARRPGWLALGLVAAVLTVIQVSGHGTGALVLAVALAIAPDLALLKRG